MPDSQSVPVTPGLFENFTGHEYESTGHHRSDSSVREFSASDRRRIPVNTQLSTVKPTSHQIAAGQVEVSTDLHRSLPTSGYQSRSDRHIAASDHGRDLFLPRHGYSTSDYHRLPNGIECRPRPRCSLRLRAIIIHHTPLLNAAVQFILDNTKIILILMARDRHRSFTKIRIPA